MSALVRGLLLIAQWSVVVMHPLPRDGRRGFDSCRRSGTRSGGHARSVGIVPRHRTAGRWVATQTFPNGAAAVESARFCDLPALYGSTARVDAIAERIWEQGAEPVELWPIGLEETEAMARNWGFNSLQEAEETAAAIARWSISA